MDLLKNPSAWIPIVLSFAMFVVFGLYFAGIIPPDPTGDEGTGAHLFQLWLVLEFFTIAFFAVKWLPQKPAEAFGVLAAQIILVLLGCFPVFYFHL